ncbi:hypothetical protein REIFOR_02099 [Reinekea forsetii]|uniref:Uncharacterized protein n=1 Tax=Reinekea forsetii TaxID=1336806 RepID=A0A2K8KR88_9GAMM|nr:hypothetical protein REIFOR_02099 [Reinekea forsetii]
MLFLRMTRPRAGASAPIDWSQSNPWGRFATTAPDVTGTVPRQSAQPYALPRLI